MTKEQIAKKLYQWLDIINYWTEEIRDVAERYDDKYFMYEKYNKMTDEIWEMYKKLKQGE